ncbi:unannotated protein [freshwater metagenome]|uniref:Unannotated protein n=1 Tax=freshwater metagenome TaxID=449393 RepID=A0A6J5Z4X3_9ZZZZ
MRAITSELTRASSRSWVTKIAVVFWERNRFITSVRNSARRWASKAENGSSNKIIAGLTASALASATLVCWPPDNSFGILLSKPTKSIKTNISFTVCLICSLVKAERSIPNAIFSAIFKCGNRAPSWGT